LFAGERVRYNRRCHRMSATNSTLSVTPLGAGDLIDRAVRFYRAHFRVFIFMAAPPVIVGTLVSVGWRMLGRELFFVGTRIEPSEVVFYYIYLWLGGLAIWFTEIVATLVVMGGASRNFVRHLLFDEPISFLATYRDVRKRLGGLIVASSIITILLGVVGVVVFYFGLFIAAMAITLVIWALSFFPIGAFLVGLALTVVIIGASVWLFSLIASRFAYVPQVMLVEDQGAFASIGRSASLASGNVKRFAALLVFTTVATYSALALFYVPLLWYAWANGLDLFSGQAELVPAWYEIASQLIWQAAFILLSPVWMVGLCLLYIDERVRHEGYDIELAAARRLGEIPDVPPDYINPLQPALGSQSSAAPNAPSRETSQFTTLGLR